MENLLTPNVAVVLMLAGVGPVFVSLYLLLEDWQKPGVLWFLAAMLTGGVWALLFSLMTLIHSPRITYILGHFFWPTITAAAVTMFLLAYEFVFKTTASRRSILALFTPVVVLFVLSWFNPRNLVYTADYYIDAQGFLHFPLIGGPLRLLVVQLYGYLLVFLAAGMFVGEAMRTTGVQRRQASYLLLVFSTLIITTIIKVAGLIPVYYDLTSTVLAFSGLFFAYSIHSHGLLKFVPVAREHTFEEVDEILLVVDANNTIIDVNRSGRSLFGDRIIDTPLDAVLPAKDHLTENRDVESIHLTIDGDDRYFSCHSTPIEYGRGVSGRIVALGDITEIKERERDLNLLKEIFSRMFRHNIRNDISVINGYAELIEEHTTDEVGDWAGRIQATAAQLYTQTEKIQTIEAIIAQDDTITGPLTDAIETALENIDTGNVTIQTDIEPVTVEHHPRLHLAIEELVENAILHHSGPETPTVSLTTSQQGSRTQLTIEDTGPGIPQKELDVLEAQRETDLEHSTGIGLWLVRWIVTQSAGSLHGNLTDQGTRITIELPTATPSNNHPEPTSDSSAP